MNGTLESIVERVLADDPDGLDELLRRVRPLVYRWALVRTTDADDAEDVTQMVLVSVHDRIAGFNRDSRFTTWLYRVTANAAAEQHRRRGVIRRLRERLIGRSPSHSSTAPDPLAAVEDERARARIDVLLHGLSRAQRTLVDLVDLQGYTPSEAAEMLEMNPNTARVHLLRGRRGLRRRILETAAADWLPIPARASGSSIVGNEVESDVD